MNKNTDIEEYIEKTNPPIKNGYYKELFKHYFERKPTTKEHKDFIKKFVMPNEQDKQYNTLLKKLKEETNEEKNG